MSDQPNTDHLIVIAQNIHCIAQMLFRRIEKVVQPFHMRSHDEREDKVGEHEDECRKDSEL